MNLEETTMILSSLRGAYPNFYRGMSKKEAESTILLWNKMFVDYDYQIVDAAVSALITSDTKGFPPVIGQVMEKIRLLTQPKEMTASEAWALVYKAICNSGYESKREFEKLPPEIQSVVHDPAQLRSWALDPNFNMGVESSNFKRSYEARVAQLREFNALPSSIKQLAIAAGNGFDFDSRLALMEGGEKK